MSFLPRTFISNDPTTSFHPLFRMLDEFDQYSRDVDRSATRTHLKTFTPKFDLREVKDGYELHGELPGIDQKDIEIEFTDANTLTVKGRTERKYESGTRPAGFVEAPAAKGAITEEAHKATVEDEDAEPTATQVAKKDTKPAPAHKEPEEKYWVSERSVGEFSRSFSFPVRVDQDAVQASMKNGILSILVPKAKKQASKKISIQ